MNARALPHRPTSKRPARRRLTLSPVDCVRVTRLSPSFSWAIPRVAVRSPSTKRFCSGVGGGGDASADSAAAHPRAEALRRRAARSEEHTSELQSLAYLVCRLLLEKKNDSLFR